VAIIYGFNLLFLSECNLNFLEKLLGKNYGKKLGKDFPDDILKPFYSITESS